MSNDNNPFMLPPPWNAGYALPSNVDAEGLERRTITTLWSKRGTFDNPAVGDGGYALPQYVRDEKYGRGAFTTRWAPRGSYFGPRIPHWLDRQTSKVVATAALPGGATKMKIEAMAGVEVSKTGEAPFTNYGVTSAAALIETVKMMPPDLRSKQLHKALDRIDPKLYSKGEELATDETKAGAPPLVALERGLAVAMSHGMARELVDLGKGKKPAKRTQLGACLSCMTPLGDFPPVRAGFCWIPATATAPGRWERARATGCATDQTGVTAAAPTVRTQGGGVTVTDASGVVKSPGRPARPAPQIFGGDQKFLKIGPFLIPTNLGAYRDHRKLTDEKLTYVDQNIAIAAKAGGVSIAEMKTGKYPFVRFKSPSGENWGLFYTEGDGKTVVAYHKVGPSMLGNIISDAWDAVVDAAEWVGGAIASVFKKIWEGIKWVAAKVVDFVKDAVEWIKDKACDLFTSPVGQIAGAAAGAYVGGPTGAQAGAMGAQAVAQACSDPVAQQPTGPAPSTGGSSLLPILLIGGAGVAAVLLLGKKK